MKKIDKLVAFYWAAAITLAVMSLTILAMPYAVENSEHNRALVVSVGLVFWAFALSGYGFLISANTLRKKIIRSKYNVYSSITGNPGIVSFFSNVYAIVADTTMIISFVLFIAISFTELKASFFAYILLALLVFSIHMHSLFNGKIFKVILASRNIKNTRR